MADPISKTFLLNVDGTDRKIFMSFGLLNTLAGYFETPNQIEEALLNSNVRASILVEALSERQEDGRIKKPMALDSADIDSEQVFDFFDWVASHIEDFFMLALKRANQRMQKTKRLNT